MNGSLLLLWMLVLSGGSAAGATGHSESCNTNEELNDLCGTHTFQSVKPILNYVDQLQREQLIYEQERKETKQLRAKVQELELKLRDGKSNENLILRQDTHIKDLQATISVLLNSNNFLQQNVESVNAEIDKVKSFIKEELANELSKIDSSASKLRNYEDQLEKNDKTVAEYTAQLKSKEESLQSCEFRLNRSQNVVSDCKHQLKNRNETIARNTATISQLEEDNERKDQTLKNIQKKLKENQEELQKQKKITDKTVPEYAAQLKSKEESLQSCKLRLNETQNVNSECKVQLENQNKNIALNTATISELRADIERKDQTLKNTQANLEVNQEELQKQKKITEQMKEEVTKLEEKIKEKEEKPTGCTSFGDFNVHNVKIPNFGNFPVLCNSEIAGPGWTVIQQRINGREDFNRNWKDYKNGFGEFSGEFFLGLEKIHRLTNNTPHELYIHMEAFKVGHYEKLSFHARYDNFSIAGEDDKYRLLSLGTHSGDKDWDKMRHSERAQFSTFDSDNDKWSDGNCAIKLHAGWWYNGCAACNLNGKYYQEEVDIRQSNWWDAWFSLKTIKMLIRPRGN